MSSEHIAHDCGTIVLTDSLSAIHQPETLDAWVRVKTGSDRYDLVSLPCVESYHPDVVNVLAGDIATAISLHRNERLLAYSHTGLTNMLSTIRARLPAEIGKHLRIEEYQLGQKNVPYSSLTPSETLVISCMDWRLHGESGGLLWKLGEATGEDATEFDLLATAGGGKELVPGKPRWNLIKSRIDATRVKRVIVLSHTDCGAYGGNSAFSSHTHQLAQLSGGLHDALRTLTSSERPIEVVAGIAHVDETLNRVKRIQLFE